MRFLAGRSGSLSGLGIISAVHPFVEVESTPCSKFLAAIAQVGVCARSS